MNRRRFLREASALTVSAVALRASASTASAFVAESPRIHTLLFDGRYSACREFSDRLVLEGAKAFDVRPDAAPVWYGRLRNHLTARGGCLAGLTTYSDCLLAESFGRDFGLAVKYEGTHDSRRSDLLVHRLRTVANADEIGAALSGSDSEWAEALAAALARSAWVPAARGWRHAAAYTSSCLGHPGFLQSWLLAPKTPG